MTEHDGPPVSLDRIATTHSSMPRETIITEDGHRIYKQGHEQCYICALLSMVERYEDAAQAVLNDDVSRAGDAWKAVSDSALQQLRAALAGTE